MLSRLAGFVCLSVVMVTTVTIRAYDGLSRRVSSLHLQWDQSKGVWNTLYSLDLVCNNDDV